MLFLLYVSSPSHEGGPHTHMGVDTCNKNSMYFLQLKWYMLFLLHLSSPSYGSGPKYNRTKVLLLFICVENIRM